MTITTDQISEIIASADPINIPSKYIIAARVSMQSGEVIDMSGLELKEFLKTSNGHCGIQLLTDISSFRSDVNNIVSDVMMSFNNTSI